VGCPQVLDQARQPFRPEPDAEAVLGDVHPLHQELDKARLLGREQLVPERIEVMECRPDLALADRAVLLAAARDVCMTISGVVSRCLTWSTTAASTSPAGTRPTGQASLPCFSTAVDT
jgi:hypothetical protein